MPAFWKKITGVLVVNEAEDDQEAVLDTTAPDKDKKDKKSKKNGQEKQKETAMVDLSPEERQEKKAELKYKREPTCCDRMLFGKRIRLLYVVLLCLLFGLAIPYLLASFAFPSTTVDSRGFCGLNVSYRFECLPGSLPGESYCHGLGCCYDLRIDNDVYAPICFHSIPSEYGYTIQNIQSKVLRSQPVVYKMGDKQELTLNLTSLRDKTTFNTTAWPLQLKVQRQGNDLVRLLLWSPENDRGIVDDFQPANGTDAQLDVIIDEKEGGDFNVTVIRVATNETLIETVYGPLIYGEKYIEITSRIPTRFLYGLGQRDNFELLPNFDHRDRWALFSREDNENGGSTYGAHPFFMNFEKSGNMYGLYLRNSAPVEVGVLPIPAVVFRAVGGVVDLRLMAGPTPRDVTRQYTGMVGLPALPPYWALGYHLCRTSSNTSEYEGIVQGMEESEIPYESDCIDARLTYPNPFSELSEEALQRISDMKDAGRKFLLVQYPFVPVKSKAYDGAQAKQVLLEVSYLNESLPYYGSIEGEAVGYPDFLDEDSFSKWLREDPSITQLYSHADGVLLFRNTPLNQVNLNYTAWTEPAGPNCTASTPENCCPRAGLPFLPNGLKDINIGTLCQAVQHGSPSGDSLLRHQNLEVHNSYGLFHQRRIHQLMKHVKNDRRPLLTSQSTHPGSGVDGGHFGGFYSPNFVAQQKGLVQVLEMGLYGVPMAGVPICGSINYTSDELTSEWCLRGHQMAAYWPFMMSHYEYGHAPRNPPNFSMGFRNQLKYVVKQRYMILPYLYTLFYEAYTMGVPVVRPLFYEYPEDPGSRTVGRQFLLGDALLVSPVFRTIGEATSIKVQVHFPPGCWYAFFTGFRMSDSTNGTDQSLLTQLTDVIVHVSGGTILPLQGNLNDLVSTTQGTRNKAFWLIVALSCPSSTPTPTTSTTPTRTSQEDIIAHGKLYLDDGVTPADQDPSADQLEMTATAHQLTVTRLTPADGELGLCNTGFSTVIDIVKVYGAAVVSEVTVNGVVSDSGSWISEVDTSALTINNISYNWCLQDSPLTLTWH